MAYIFICALVFFSNAPDQSDGSGWKEMQTWPIWMLKLKNWNLWLFSDNKFGVLFHSPSSRWPTQPILHLVMQVYFGTLFPVHWFLPHSTDTDFTLLLEQTYMIWCLKLNDLLCTSSRIIQFLHCKNGSLVCSKEQEEGKFCPYKIC